MLFQKAKENCNIHLAGMVKEQKTNLAKTMIASDGIRR